MLLKLHYKLDDGEISSHITDLLWLSNCAYYKICTFSVFSIILFLEPKHLSLLVIGACQSASCSFQMLSSHLVWAAFSSSTLLLCSRALLPSTPALCCSSPLLLSSFALLVWHLCQPSFSVPTTSIFGNRLQQPPYRAVKSAVCSAKRSLQ